MLKKFNIIGHRGFGPTGNRIDHPYPENTLKAFQYVLDNGADGIELDVLITNDGRAVVIHDQRLHEHVVPEQVEAASQKPVGDCSYEELQGFDLGEGQKIPALYDVFQTISQYSTQKIINLDVKDIKTVEPILEEIKRTGAGLQSHHVIISSYNWDILRAFRKRDKDIHLVPAIKSVLLFGKDNVEAGTYRPLSDTYQTGFEAPVIDIHKEIKASAFDCAIPDYTPALIDLARSQQVGLQLSTGRDRVNAEQTDYKILQSLQQSTETGVPFVICKVDEPQGVMKKMQILSSSC